MSAARRTTRRNQLVAGVVSVTLHVGFLAAFMAGQVQPMRRWEPPQIVPVTLVEPLIQQPDTLNEPAPAPPADLPPADNPPKASPPPPPQPPTKLKVRDAKPSPTVAPVVASERATPVANFTVVGEGQLAGATGAESGGGGGACNMVRRLQDKLRKDAAVQRAMARAHSESGAGRGAVLVWNGDWVRSPGEEGKGLAVVREAILFEVGFAPAACRAEPMRGLVVISLNEAGTVRLALGHSQWKWSDMLFAHAPR